MRMIFHASTLLARTLRLCVWAKILSMRQSLTSSDYGMFAATVGSPELVKIFLSLNAKHSTVEMEGRSPLYAAALAGHRDIVKALLDGGADHGKAPRPLHFVQDPEVLAVLLEDSADVDGPTKDQETPLLAALRCGYMEVSLVIICLRH